MKKAILFLNKYFFPALLPLTLIFVVVMTLIEWFIRNSSVIFWIDEILMMSMANHEPLSKLYFVAFKEMPGAMPLPFLEFWGYLELLRPRIPLPDLMKNLEMILRLPLTIYMAIIIGFGFWMSRRLSQSTVVAALLTLCLLTFNSLASHLGAELRHHTSGFMHGILSWFFLTMLLTTTPEEKRSKMGWLIAWTFSATLASWSHVYSIYMVFVQLAVFFLAEFSLLPGGLQLEGIHRLWKMLGLLFVFGNNIFAAAFFRFFVTQPYARNHQFASNWEAWQHNPNALGKFLFTPHFYFWIAIFITLSLINLLRTSDNKERIKKSLLISLGILQFVLIIFLTIHYFRLGWGPDPWLARYVMAGVPPLIFVMSYLTRGLINPQWKKCFAPLLAISILILFFIKPDINESYWKNGNGFELTGDQRWIQLRERILAQNAYGKIPFVMGLSPNENAISQTDIYGAEVNQTWQLYSGGPYAIGTIYESKMSQFGGRIPLPCEVRDKIPVAKRPAKIYALDFCEKEKIILRVIKY
jgi:hypothetical protein